ncbi:MULTISPECIES: YheC/YheD family endospore coat-associated protein [Bacillaceae]|uniref:YheC/YheD family endospore coat-associated protein n=1 Tax=Bacillaceae TaxID=186817 RepID=UPI002965589F|nr:YheC/YheD family protein [Bacillus infantis]MDW2877378.1 YheC/YheD family protein [Bacillus infantis]
MRSLGFMSLRSTSEKAYATEIAKRARSCGIECFRFIPSAIDPRTELISGEKYDPDKEDWETASFPLPDVLYDRCFYGNDPHSRQCRSIVHYLKNRSDILFLGHGLPNKLELYKILAQSTLAPYIPKSIHAQSAGQVLQPSSLVSPMILKPANGSQGAGIYYLEMQKDGLLVKTDTPEKQISRLFADQKKAAVWLGQLLSGNSYLLQPYLPLSNEDNQPFDIRILLQKNEAGKWREMGRGVRVGRENGIISNLSAGSAVSSFETWLENSSVSSSRFLRAELSEISNALPEILEDALPPLFEIGLDIGIARDGAIWILDVNSKPGRKVILETDPDKKEALYRAPLLYGKLLTSAGQAERRKNSEKTVSH